MDDQPNELLWWGRSRKTYRSFPESVKDDLGFELHLVQIGEMPTDYKRMKAIGRGAYEIRSKGIDGEYRVFLRGTHRRYGSRFARISEEVPKNIA